VTDFRNLHSTNIVVLIGGLDQKSISVSFKFRAVSFAESTKQRTEMSAINHGSRWLRRDKKMQPHIYNVITTPLVIPTEDHALSFRHYFPVRQLLVSS